jgi:hypothetical protein
LVRLETVSPEVTATDQWKQKVCFYPSAVNRVNFLSFRKFVFSERAYQGAIGFSGILFHLHPIDTRQVGDGASVSELQIFRSTAQDPRFFESLLKAVRELRL